MFCAIFTCNQQVMEVHLIFQLASMMEHRVHQGHQDQRGHPDHKGHRGHQEHQGQMGHQGQQDRLGQLGQKGQGEEALSMYLAVVYTNIRDN